MTLKYKIDRLISESTGTGQNSNGRPDLLAFTRATTNLIYTDLVAIQHTTQPVAALFGVKYLNPYNEISAIVPSTFGGQYNTADRDGIAEFTGGPYNKGDVFKFANVVYHVVKDGYTFTGANNKEKLFNAVIASAIVFGSEAADTSKYEDFNTDMSEAKFEINKWQAPVKSRKIKTEMSIEVVQDLEASGFDAPEFIEDLLATQTAEEINKEIQQGLITVSTRYQDDSGITTGSILDLSNAQFPGRVLYKYVCLMNAEIQKNTTYSATYVVASPSVAATLESSGWVCEEDDTPIAALGTLKNGLHLYVDATTPYDYIIVGTKASYGEGETVGSLFFAPYVEGTDIEKGEDIGQFKVTNDPDALQPSVMIMARYALCVNPYTMGLDNKTAKVVDSTNLRDFAGQSKMSYIMGVKIPQTVTAA